MNEEEKQAIDWLKEELDDEKKSHKNCNYSYKGVTGLYGNNEVEIALKLIEKQQKEIEELKDFNVKLQATKDRLDSYDKENTLEIEKLKKEIEKLKSRKYIINAETNEIKEIPISDDYISKDKIRKRIKEVEEQLKSIEIVKFHKDIKERLVILKYELEKLLGE